MYCSPTGLPCFLIWFRAKSKIGKRGGNSD